jgi:DNA replication and repair protein RecF
VKIDSIQINNLRNHKRTELDFNEGVNLLIGLNGAGKTTVLEGISICGFSKSFLPVSDSSLISQDEEFYNVSLVAENDIEINYKINVRFIPGMRKIINSSLGENLLAKDIIGEIPLVILSPDFKNITFGSPQDRREFIDRLLSQASKIYLEEAINYKRALRQRNNLLSNAKLDRQFDYSLLDPWTEILLKSGSELIIRRLKFISDFVPVFRDIYGMITEADEVVNLEYSSNGIDKEILNNFSVQKDVYDYLNISSKKLLKNEIKRGVTLFGPQKDDLRITINDGIAKEYASQGQHKSLLISLKFAEYNFLKNKKNETPIILLDDIFSELDKERTKKVFDMIINNQCQTFITSTEETEMKKLLKNYDKCKFFEVDKGKIKQ